MSNGNHFIFYLLFLKQKMSSVFCLFYINKVFNFLDDNKCHEVIGALPGEFR